jgi:hypothetical protein
MSFDDYKSNTNSGSGTATATATAVGNSGLNGHLIIQVATGGDGIEILGTDGTTGILLLAGERISLMVDNLSKVLVKREDATNVAFTYWGS